MKFVFVLFFLIFSTSFNMFSQTEIKCGTEDPSESYITSQPWYGNEEFLQHFSDSILTNMKSATSSLVENVIFHVPVQFWVNTKDLITLTLIKN
jgi:hypothetical protein